MINRKTESSSDLPDTNIVKPDTRQTRSRTVSFLTAIVLSCLAGWWVQSVRSTSGLSLPYVRTDVIIVNLLCMLPLALLLSEWMFDVLKHFSFHLFLLTQSVFFIGTAVILIQAITGNQASGTLNTYDAWESFFLRPAWALWIMTSVLLTVRNGSRSQRQSLTSSQGILVWCVVCITAFVVPSFYVESRANEMVTKIEEHLSSGRIGDARQLTREVSLLSPWAKIDNKPVGDIARDLDLACYDIEQSLAAMKRRPIAGEEYTYHMARLHAILGQRDVATKLLEPWSHKASTSPLTYQLLGNIYQQEENWTESERCYQRSLKAWQKLPKSEQREAGMVSAWNGIGFAERKRGNYEAAENAYLSALLSAPTADQHFLLAQFYEDTQQTDKSRDHAQQAMALDAARYETSGKKLITSLQQQHFGCLNVWRNRIP